MSSTSSPEIPYRIRRSPRAKRIRVTVETGGDVEVVLPRRASEADAAAAVAELRGWIERRRAVLESAREERPRAHGTVPYLGRDLVLVPQRGRRQVARRGDLLLVPEAGTDRREALERFYRREAKRVIGAKLDAATAHTGRPYTGLTIRGQRTRWASCSSRGGMSFNWRLMLAPEEVVDYVVWHEVCHLEVMDHSARFWALLESRCPDWRSHSRWLKRYGATLVL